MCLARCGREMPARRCKAGWRVKEKERAAKGEARKSVLDGILAIVALHAGGE